MLRYLTGESSKGTVFLQRFYFSGPVPESCPLLHPVHSTNVGSDNLQNVVPSGQGFVGRQERESPHVFEVETTEVRPKQTYFKNGLDLSFA